MKTLEEKYKQLTQMLAKLEKVINHDCEHGGAECEIRRDGEIKRFEYTFDVISEYLKTYLHEYHKVIVHSIKDLFKECQAAGIIDGGQAKLLMEMAEMYNEAEFAYEKEIRKHILEKIPVFHECMANIALKAKPNG